MAKKYMGKTIDMFLEQVEVDGKLVNRFESVRITRRDRYDFCKKIRIIDDITLHEAIKEL